MANQFSEADNRLFENTVEHFESTQSVATRMPVVGMNMTAGVRGGLTEWRDHQQFSTIIMGRDVSGSDQDLVELFYPVDIAESDISNTPLFSLTAVERNDQRRLDNKAKSVAHALAADVDSRAAEVVSMEGSVVSRIAGFATNYDHYTPAESLLLERGVPATTKRAMGLGIRPWARVSGDLSKSNGQFRDSTAEKAYRDSIIPNIAGFDTFRAQYLPSLTAQGATITVAGAGQKHVPAPNGSNNRLQDNREMVLAVSAGAGLQRGDAFTIAGVNALEMVRKTDTGQLQTFRVREVNGNNVTIAPAIIVTGGGTDAEDLYANCSAAPADGAAITFLNDTNDTTPSPFWADNSIEICHGELDTSDLGDSMSVMEGSLSNGIKLYMFKQGKIEDLNAKYRFTIWVNPQVLCYEACGVTIDNQ